MKKLPFEEGDLVSLSLTQDFVDNEIFVVIRGVSSRYYPLGLYKLLSSIGGTYVFFSGNVIRHLNDVDKTS